MMKKSNTRRNSVLLAAAIAGLAALGLSRQAMAQYPAGQDGHAHDANNRVGSGGQNSGRPGGGSVTPNDYINRNVTGLGAFHGPINERDPRSFTGPVPGQGVDAFVRQSSGAPIQYGATASPIGQVQAFYGDARFTTPPNGSIPVGYNGGYIGTIPQTSASLSNGFNTAQYLYGLQSRSDNPQSLLLRELGNYNIYDPQYGFDQTGSLNYVIPYGTRTINTGSDTFNPLGGSDRFGAENQNIDRMRQELRDSANPNSAQPNQNDSTNPLPPDLNKPLNQPLARPFDAGADSTIINRPVGLQAGNNPLSSTGVTRAGPMARPTLVPPELQTPLLQLLQKRLEETDVGKVIVSPYVTHPQAPATPTRVPGQNNVGPTGNNPVKVTSLAEGVKAKGLHDLLAGAEDLLRQGKYDEAVASYDQSQRVAPNNALMVLGRAQAELAGGYYARAETDLRTAFRFNPALMMLQFDLRSLLPKGRFDFVHKDLQELAQKDTESARPWFLLAYLDYSAGQTDAVTKDLKAAEDRSANDQTVSRLRQVWAPQAQSGKPAPSTVAPTTLPSGKSPAVAPLNK